MSQEELNKQATEQNNTETEIEDIKEDKKSSKKWWIYNKNRT